VQAQEMGGGEEHTCLGLEDQNFEPDQDQEGISCSSY